MKNVQTKLELALGHNQYSILTSLVYLENMYNVLKHTDSITTANYNSKM